MGHYLSLAPVNAVGKDVGCNLTISLPLMRETYTGYRAQIARCLRLEKFFFYFEFYVIPCRFRIALHRDVDITFALGGSNFGKIGFANLIFASMPADISSVIEKSSIYN